MNRHLQFLAALLLCGTIAYASRPESTSPPASAGVPSSAGWASGGDCPCGPDCQCAAACQAVLADALQRIADLEASGAVESEPTLADASPDAHTLMLFSATWCAPCRPCHGYAAEMAMDGWDVVEVDVTASPEVMQQYDVRQVPTWIILEDGIEEVRWTGNNRQHVINNCAVALDRDHHALNATAANGLQYVSYTASSPAYRTYSRTYSRTVYRQREVCPTCQRPIRRGRR